MIPRWLAVVAVVWLALTGCQSGPVCGGSVARCRPLIDAGQDAQPGDGSVP